MRFIRYMYIIYSQLFKYSLLKYQFTESSLASAKIYGWIISGRAYRPTVGLLYPVHNCYFGMGPMWVAEKCWCTQEVPGPPSNVHLR